MIKPRVRRILLVATVGLGVGLSLERAETHKPITSKYTYHDDVFPILREHCGRCHVADGIAPMSLMTYSDALPWGEAIRAEIISGHMPPWHAQESAVRFKNAPTITAAEVDRVLVWVSGGSPQGNPQNPAPRVAVHHDWPLGKPDLVLPLPETALPADKSEIVREFTIATRTTEPQWVRSADILPGTPAIVRNATISVSVKPTADSSQLGREPVLAVWVPGDDPVDAGSAAFFLPAGGELVVRLHYRKTYRYEGMEMTDHSAVGLYFAHGPTSEIRRFTVNSAPVSLNQNSVTFSRIVNEDLRALALRPDALLSNARLQVDAVSPRGVRTPVIRLAVRPDWTRRYWFDQPLTLPRGSRIEVIAVLNGADTLLPPAGSPLPPQAIDGSPLNVMFDVIQTGTSQTEN